MTRLLMSPFMKMISAFSILFRGLYTHDFLPAQYMRARNMHDLEAISAMCYSCKYISVKPQTFHLVLQQIETNYHSWNGLTFQTFLGIYIYRNITAVLHVLCLTAANNRNKLLRWGASSVTKIEMTLLQKQLTCVLCCALPIYILVPSVRY